MYIIGIDLGTTNCTMAYTSQKDAIQQFAIPQADSNGAAEEQAILPSFIYFPLEEELQAKAGAIPWDLERTFCVGAFARDRGKELPYRMVASAKSWLCHLGVDRREALLPLGADEEGTPKISPLDACSELLRHLKEAWDYKMELPFEEQQILITVPASFDPSARQLVQEAAEKAGYPEIILLEEPQAAFYAWLHTHDKHWRKILTVGDTILVVDIGGGTTDFSLIQVNESGGDLILERLAVGSHLLLGGDNIDLGLAYLAKNKLEEKGHTIDDWQLQALVHACRQAKEQLLGDHPPAEADIAIMGRGSRLIGGTLKTTLSQEEIRNFVIDGFTPFVASNEHPAAENRAGMQQIGLPYAQDPRITFQLAQFLSNGNPAGFPTAVLFNGGTTKAASLRQRVIEQLNAWAKEAGHPALKELEGADYDFAVSRGAVYYGLARTGDAIRIKSGTSRSYFIGVEDAAPAVPGIATPMKAICIAPFGMEEGTSQNLEQREFALVLGEQATFRFFSAAVSHPLGTIIRNWKQELVELHPIEARLPNEEGDGKTIRVKIHSKVTELGVLEIWCVAADGRKWKLEFDIRKEEALV